MEAPFLNAAILSLKHTTTLASNSSAAFALAACSAAFSASAFARSASSTFSWALRSAMCLWRICWRSAALAMPLSLLSFLFWTSTSKEDFASTTETSSWSWEGASFRALANAASANSFFRPRLLIDSASVSSSGSRASIAVLYRAIRDSSSVLLATLAEGPRSPTYLRMIASASSSLKGKGTTSSHKLSVTTLMVSGSRSGIASQVASLSFTRVISFVLSVASVPAVGAFGGSGLGFTWVGDSPAAPPVEGSLAAARA